MIAHHADTTGMIGLNASNAANHSRLKIQAPCGVGNAPAQKTSQKARSKCLAIVESL